MNRREMLLGTALFGASLASPRGQALTTPFLRSLEREDNALYPEPFGRLALPTGFTAVALQRAGDTMTDGVTVPGQPDGMGCFEHQGHWVLLRNQELGNEEWMNWVAFDALMVPAPVDSPKAFTKDAFGGVSRVVLDPVKLKAELAGAPPEVSAAIVRSNLVLTGTDRNCGGGVTRRGWVSCEESDNKGHGWALLTRPGDDALVSAAERTLRHWGRFNREAIAMTTDERQVYMTEDRPDGLFYRLVTDDSVWRNGTLQALSVAGWTHTDQHQYPDTGTPWRVGTELTTTWVNIPDPSASKQTCREQGAALGASRFNRCEGTAILGSDDRMVWFVASTAGPAAGGQLWRYDRHKNTLKLVVEIGSRDPTGLLIGQETLSMPDNLVFTPDGSLMLAEDNYARTDKVKFQHLRVRVADGRIFDVAKNLHNKPANPGKYDSPGGEFTGACFSPDGTVLFVNIQGPEHLTLAIAGPFSG